MQPVDKLAFHRGGASSLTGSKSVLCSVGGTVCETRVQESVTAMEWITACLARLSPPSASTWVRQWRVVALGYPRNQGPIV